MSGWGPFFGAVAGSAAALTGLVFVAVSINLTKILSIPRITDRALEALVLLLAVLVAALLMLVPNQTFLATAYEMAGLGGVTWLATLRLDLHAWKDSKPEFKNRLATLIAMNQIAVVSFVTGGVQIYLAGVVGLDWIVFGMLLSIVKACADAWVLLVEINR